MELKNVTKIYRTPAGDVPALKNINATFNKGEFVGIIGKSGAGKSTLVNMLTGVDGLTEGEIWIDGVNVHAQNQNQMALWRGKHIGVVYQSFELLNQLSLLDNVMLPMDFCGLWRPGKSQQRAMQLLEDVEIAEHAYKSPSRISGGQQQRVAIARALVNDPIVIVGDEPTGSLDSATSNTIINLFEGLVAQGRTVVMVTHDHSLEPRFTHLLHITDGEIVKDERREVVA
ncbi:MAG: ABC transporter ATP-binding protein [Anaerolineales bacterium]|nr:ABC transporter ATP-binding protein [Anaerolineales bacterium]